MNVVPLYMMPFREVFLLFIIFSFVGWCSEVLYVGLFFEHKFINRGFLHGPICPIYGFGGCSILLLPPVILNSWIPLFLTSMILCTAVEYFISWLLEKMFHTLWWDYSHYKFNIKGRICLLNSLLFGIMGLLSVHFAIPYVLKFISLFSSTTITLSSDVLAVVLAIDEVITIRQLVDFNTTMAKIKTFAETLKDHYGHEEWFRSDSISEMIASIKEHASSTNEKVNEKIFEHFDKLMNQRKTVESFMKRFPTMKSFHYKDEFALVKQHIKKLHKSN